MATNPDPLKLFISYSHKDKSFLDELRTHLTPLKKSGLVEVWCDKELVSGDQLDPEIEKNLLAADLVAILVSPDFFASLACYETELKKTLERTNNSDVRIIPIIVRPCHWKDTIFSEYLVATQDGEPISKYGNRDEAWVEVVESIDKVANKFIDLKRNKANNNSSKQDEKPTLSSDFLKILNDTEVVFQHKNKEQLVLEDIFVYPDLKNIKREYDEIEKTVSSDEILSLSNKANKLLILGNEQSGKTALAKMLYKSYFSQGYLPLLCGGQEINSTDIDKLLSRLVPKQYSNLTYEAYVGQKRHKILLIDDYDKLKLNARYQKKFLDKALKIAGRLILISDSSLKYDEDKLLELSDYSQYEILSLGHLRRNDLIDKWVSMGRVETIEPKERCDEIDRVTGHVNSIIRNNILPPKPIYVLTIIQVLDTVTPADYSLTSYGHCYQSLIQMALEKSNIKASDFDQYINYLSEIAHYIFVTGNDIIDNEQLADFKTKYSKQYLVKSHDEVVRVLMKSNILRRSEDGIHFGYRYVFYFYVAKYLTDHIDIENCKKEIECLCENIHTEKNANILIFLVHHSKDQSIIDEILLHASVVFDETEEATLSAEDTKYLLDFIDSIPDLVIEQKNVDDERENNFKTKDRLNDAIEESDDDPATEDEPNKSMLAEVNRSVRLVEIIGQIIRNRHGSLKKEQLKELSLSAYSSGLKFLNYFLTTTKDDQEPILNFIQGIYKENTSLSVNEISEKARKVFLMLCYGASYSVIKKIANSLGSEKLMPIFDDISGASTKSPAVQLIHITIQLESTKKNTKKRNI